MTIYHFYMCIYIYVYHGPSCLTLSLLVLNGPLTSPKHPLRIVARAVTNSCRFSGTNSCNVYMPPPFSPPSSRVRLVVWPPAACPGARRRRPCRPSPSRRPPRPPRTHARAPASPNSAPTECQRDGWLAMILIEDIFYFSSADSASNPGQQFCPTTR